MKGKRNNDEQGSHDLLLFAEPNFRTSRRNFVAAAASTLAAAGALFMGLGAKAARAQGINEGPLPGCSPSDNQPNKCSCFLSGTRIATPHKEVEIDKLQIGDLVLSLSGEPKPIKWIGRSSFTRLPSKAWNKEVAPVKVARFALDGATPHRDLYLSPGHALYLHGLLVPVRHLVNGHSITDNEYADASTLAYFHIELEEHDAVLAEGALAESYLGDDRWAFDNAEEYEALYGTNSRKRPFAPKSLNGGRQELMSRFRSAVSPIYDARKPVDIIRDQIASRA